MCRERYIHYLYTLLQIKTLHDNIEQPICLNGSIKNLLKNVSVSQKLLQIINRSERDGSLTECSKNGSSIAPLVLREKCFPQKMHFKLCSITSVSATG